MHFHQHVVRYVFSTVESALGAVICKLMVNLNALRAVRHRASAAVIELAFHCRSPLLVLVLSH